MEQQGIERSQTRFESRATAGERGETMVTSTRKVRVMLCHGVKAEVKDEAGRSVGDLLSH